MYWSHELDTHQGNYVRRDNFVRHDQHSFGVGNSKYSIPSCLYCCSGNGGLEGNSESAHSGGYLHPFGQRISQINLDSSTYPTEVGSGFEPEHIGVPPSNSEDEAISELNSNRSVTSTIIEGEDSSHTPKLRVPYVPVLFKLLDSKKKNRVHVKKFFPKTPKLYPPAEPIVNFKLLQVIDSKKHESKRIIAFANRRSASQHRVQNNFGTIESLKNDSLDCNLGLQSEKISVNFLNATELRSTGDEEKSTLSVDNSTRLLPFPKAPPSLGKVHEKFHNRTDDGYSTSNSLHNELRHSPSCSNNFYNITSEMPEFERNMPQSNSHPLFDQNLSKARPNDNFYKSTFMDSGETIKMNPMDYGSQLHQGIVFCSCFPSHCSSKPNIDYKNMRIGAPVTLDKMMKRRGSGGSTNSFYNGLHILNKANDYQFCRCRTDRSDITSINSDKTLIYENKLNARGMRTKKL